MMYTVLKKCPCCGEISYVAVDLAQYNCWLEGMLIQDAMPDMSDTERETLISGLCADCQSDYFGDEDEPSDQDYEDYGPDECGFDPYEGCYTYDC